MSSIVTELGSIQMFWIFGVWVSISVVEIKDGKAIARFEPTAAPDSVEVTAAIKKALSDSPK